MAAPPTSGSPCARERVAPLVADLEAWMRAERAKLSRHAEVAKAMNYMLKRWATFTRFLDDGRICLTNNAAERALRGIALGRKSWLFAGSDRGGERAAVMYTLIQTARLNDVDPQAWLADVLARINDHNIQRLDQLLPWNWKTSCRQTRGLRTGARPFERLRPCRGLHRTDTLYPLAPCRGGNPNVALQRAQFEGCRRLLHQEIEEYRPRRLIFLTGLDWLSRFCAENSSHRAIDDQIASTRRDGWLLGGRQRASRVRRCCATSSMQA